MPEGLTEPVKPLAVEPLGSVLDVSLAEAAQSAENGRKSLSSVAQDATGPEESLEVKTRVVQHATPKQHVILWLIGVLLASLIPLLFIFFHGVDRGSPPSIFQLLGNGDLLLISSVITIAGITELILTMRNICEDQLMAGGIAVLSGVLAVAAEALWYADLTSQLLDGQPLAAAHSVTVGSLFFFCLSSFTSAVCVWLAAGTR